ncbi:hypothetical protein DPMN_078523 [Dreissena polymorpha]|uniref:Uncharacterized protein n=1 Tax=Dreissena polymorpha TaxID=45954 RepID=A0A9D4BQK5_DREPO|nr:hypothetical protein DPMN_078523 [Dreissena polymorpha]
MLPFEPGIQVRSKLVGVIAARSQPIGHGHVLPSVRYWARAVHVLTDLELGACARLVPRGHVYFHVEVEARCGGIFI